MNKVDIYVNGFRLDLFNDEQISINLSVQNVQDISKIFTDFTQSFTVPATAVNKQIFAFYSNTSIEDATITIPPSPLIWDIWSTQWNSANTAWETGVTSSTVPNTFDGRFRQTARIEINSLPFRDGVIELESVQLKGTEPYAYTLTFYGDLVTLSDLFGEDYLYDLDFSAYDLEYTDDNVYDGLTADDFNELFFPLMSPVKNWYYDSNPSDVGAANIAQNGSATAHGINYYELKPALKVSAVLAAMQAKYGISFTGAFLISAPFNDLSIWLHRTEGYLYDTTTTIGWQKINFNRNTGSGSQFNLTTDIWTVPDEEAYDLQITMLNVTENYELGLFRNGQFDGSAQVNAHPSSSVTTTFSNVYYGTGAQIELYIRPQSAIAFSYRCTDYSGIDSITATSAFSVDQTAGANYTFTMVVSDLMPEIKVKDFLAGILKMYNLVLVPNGATFLLQPLNEWYAAGTRQDFQTYFDITQYAVNRPPLYREIEFKYEETEQILGYQYLNTNNTGFGDLRAFFNFDGDPFNVEVPFECPLFERLTNEATGNVTNVLVYKSITSEIGSDGSFNPYLGAPILFYGYFDAYSLAGNTVMFVDADGVTKRTVSTAWYANTSNRYSSAAASDSICFGADIDPYHLQTVAQSLYQEYWEDYITDLYNKRRRLVQVDAVLPIGEIITLDLKNEVIWNNQKYIINNVQLNLTTGKATFELLNVVV
jgi:hypothetical protein